INYFKIIGEKSGEFQNPSSAMVKVSVNGKTQIGADEGDGPVNAIDKALRQALTVFYPSISDIHLVDFKVRVVDGSAATAANVRVLIESTDGKDIWTTVGASTDIINASVTALVDSIEYKLMKDNSQKNS
ncbi:MAG: citramalate synthase, partial [Oscillospiraceae bacterium]|nr:citramalate synthase [Oscillospiraceae bacterium]